jgi:hypothetical protein
MLPVDSKGELFALLNAEIAGQINKAGITEEEILADFDQWRKERREKLR